MEWTDTPVAIASGFRVTRGGDYLFTTSASLPDFVAAPNQRPAAARYFGVGVRCVSSDD